MILYLISKALGQKGPKSNQDITCLIGTDGRHGVHDMWKVRPGGKISEKWGPANAIWRAGRMWVPHGVEIERWLCNPRVSGSIPGTDNLEKLFIWMKIHGLTQISKTLFRWQSG